MVSPNEAVEGAKDWEIPLLAGRSIDAGADAGGRLCCDEDVKVFIARMTRGPLIGMIQYTLADGRLAM